MYKAAINDIPDVLQFVKRMGVSTEKTHVMVQPTVLVMRLRPESKHTSPATIVDKLNVGWLVKYFLIFDDDVVSLLQLLCLVFAGSTAMGASFLCIINPSKEQIVHVLVSQQAAKQQDH